MDHLHKLVQEIRQRLFLVLLFSNILVAVIVGLSVELILNNKSDQFTLVNVGMVAGAVILVFVLTYILARGTAKYAIEPVQVLWQAILHVSPDHQGTAAPNLEHIKLGRELVTSLVLQTYQLAGAPTTGRKADAIDETSRMIAHNLPLPVVVANNEQNVVFANSAFCTYVGLDSKDIVGKNIYSLLDLSFPNEQTLERWLEQCRTNKATASQTWDHIRLNQPDAPTKLLDLVAYYSKDNPSNIETIVTLFDRTQEYQRDENALSYVSLAVHELRTPLTILRGYIEVFEDEVAPKLGPEYQKFTHNMQASAQQLTTFVNNILNVARVENNQLILQLKEESWADTVKSAGAIMELRAKVHGKQIVYDIADGLPSVGIDKISITEVIDNLLDNAIKYSDKNDQIIVKTYLRDDGMVETTVQDFGIGISESVINNLFEKFYRNHRSRAQIGGTGLGLYLSKAIVTAHGGEIWVRSKEGIGTTFGFSIQPYSKVASESKTSDNKGVTRTAHGWIKNHSFYRR